MKIRKIFMALVFVIVLGLFNIKIAYAANSTQIYVNGYLLETSVQPIIRNGFTFMTIRELGEILGCIVDFDNTTRTVTLTNTEIGKVIKMTIGINKAYVNNNEITLQSPPIIVESRTMIPVRFVAESLDAEVTWREGYTYDLVNIPNKVIIKSNHPVKLLNTKIASFQNSNTWYLTDEKTVEYKMTLPVFSNMNDTSFQSELNKYIESIYQEIVNESTNNYNEQLKETEYHYIYSNDIDFSIINETTSTLSILLDGYYYTGGAHGMPYKTGLNIDFSRSKRLGLPDLFKVGVDYSSVLINIMNNIRMTYTDDYEYVSEVTALPDDYHFYIEDGNIVIYYHPYDLAAYARGFVEFKIPVSSLKDYLIDEYKILS